MATLVMELSVTGFVSGAQQAITWTKNIAVSLTDATNKMQRMENMLTVTSGSLVQAKSDLASLYEITDRLGVSLVDSAEPFAKLAASVTGMTKSDLFKVFDGFATALAATHASTAKVNGTFLALQQIASKGKLTMQELRRQLAEHLPGSMRIAAEAMDMTMEEFVEAVRKGTIDTNEWLIKMAEALKNNFNDAAEKASKTLNNEITRLKSNFTIFQDQVLRGEGANIKWAESVKRVSDEILKNEDIIQNTSEGVSYFSDIVTNFQAGNKQFAEQAALEFSSIGQSVSGAVSLFTASMALFSAGNRELAGTAVHLAGSVLHLSSAEKVANNLFKNATSYLDEAAKAWDRFTGKAAYQAEIDAQLAENIDARMALRAEEDKLAEELAIREGERKDAIEAQDKKIAENKKAQLAMLKKANEDHAQKVIDINRDMYDRAGVITDAFLEQERAKITASVSAWTDRVAAAKVIAQHMKDIYEGGAEAKEQARLLKEEELGVAEAAKKAAEEAAKIAAANKEATAEANKLKSAFDGAASSASSIPARSGSRLDNDEDFKNGSVAGKSSGKTHTMRGSSWLAGLSDAEKKQYKSMTPAGRGTHYYGLYGGGKSYGPVTGGGREHEYLDMITAQKEAAVAFIMRQRADVARASAEAADPTLLQGASTINNFNQQISSSDILTITSAQTTNLARA